MIFCDIYSKFYCLPNFKVLIQFLVGSVFVAGYLSRGDASFSKAINKVQESLGLIIGDVFGPGSSYEFVKTKIDETVKFTRYLNNNRKEEFEVTRKVLVNSDCIKLNNDYRFVKKSVLFLVAMYGAFVLFYCDAYCTLNISSSLFGLLLLSFVLY